MYAQVRFSDQRGATLHKLKQVFYQFKRLKVFFFLFYLILVKKDKEHIVN